MPKFFRHELCRAGDANSDTEPAPSAYELRVAVAILKGVCGTMDVETASGTCRACRWLVGLRFGADLDGRADGVEGHCAVQ